MTMVKNKLFALLFRLCALLFALIGILKSIGVFSGTVSFGSFMYYTFQSNLLAVFLFSFLAVRTAGSLRAGLQGCVGRHTRLAMVCAVDLLVTMIVFWALLAPEVPASYLWTFDNIAVHTVSPLLCLLDFILFSEVRLLKYRDIYYTCIFPLFYLAFATVAGFSGYVYYYRLTPGSIYSSSLISVPVRFPYFFLDFDVLGVKAVIYIVVLFVFFILLGHLIYFVDRKRKPTE